MDLKAAMAVVAEQAMLRERARCAKVCRDIARAYLNDVNGYGMPRHSGAYSVADGCAVNIERGEP